MFEKSPYEYEKELRQEADKKSEKKKKMKRKEDGDVLLWSLSITVGVFAGFVGCTVKLINHQGSPSKAVLSWFTTMLVVSLVTFSIQLIIHWIVSVQNKNVDMKKEANNRGAEQEARIYQHDFERAAKIESIKYEKSIFTQEIVDTIAPAIFSSIKMADRNKHIQTVTDKTCISVLKTEVRWGTWINSFYNFKWWKKFI